MNELQMDIWNKKYRYENETFEEYTYRIGAGIEVTVNAIRDGKYMVGGRIASTRGTTYKNSTTNCYVMKPPEDNLSSIFDTGKDIGLTLARGGGIGVDMSKLRPRNATISGTNYKSAGLVPFCEMYDKICSCIEQANRRGAMMISLDANHPDVEEFIKMKTIDKNVTNANISLNVSGDVSEDLIELIATSIYDWGEPGLIFKDNLYNYNYMEYFKNYQIAGVNPCGEQPLPANAGCLLGSINISALVTNGKFDLKEFQSMVRMGIRDLNLELEIAPKHPLQGQNDMVKEWKQVGLGLMGLGTLLIKLQLPYDIKNEKVNKLVNTIGRTMIEVALDESALIAKELGSFKQWNYKEFVSSRFIHNLKLSKELLVKIKRYGLRNAGLLTIAPTGTASTFLGVTGGIEPLYATSYYRKTEQLGDSDKYYEVTEPVVEDAKVNGVIPNYVTNSTSSNINPYHRIDMQDTLQKYIDTGISSTLNLKETTSIDDIKKYIKYALTKKLKGITFFRDGCKRTQILTDTNNTKCECGSDMINTNGCWNCPLCGSTKCDI